MKVIHVISGLGAGGAETYSKNLLIELKKSGCEPVLIGMDHAPPTARSRVGIQQQFIADLEAREIPWGLIGTRARRDPIYALRRLNGVFKTYRPDLIHAHLTYAAIYAGVATRTLPIIFTHHSTPVRSPMAHKLFLENRISRYIAVSSAGKASLIQQAGIKPELISIIFNGINLAAFSHCDRSQLTSSKLVIISVGNLRKEKNHPLMLNALANLIDICRAHGVCPPILKIVGDGQQRERLHRMVQDMSLEQHVEFLGLRADIPRLLAAADLFCMSSSREGLSIALIEALAAGLPIVATDVGGNGEIVQQGRCGYLTRPGDADDLTDKLWRLVKDRDLLASFSSQARQRAEFFSLDRSVHEHCRAYREVLQQTR